MTREEVIKLLVNAIYSDEEQGNEDLTTVRNMAIKAPEKETKTEQWIELFYLYSILEVLSYNKEKK